MTLLEVEEGFAVECFVGLIFKSSSSLSDSVSINFLDLELGWSLPTGLAVADFLGTTLDLEAAALVGCFFDAPGFFLTSVSESSSLFCLGLALALVTNPDFLMTGFFLFFSADGGSFSFLLGLLVGLL